MENLSPSSETHRRANHQKTLKDGRVVCLLCPHRCTMKEGERGLCSTRLVSDGVLMNEAYGQVTALHLDPIEKKPLATYAPGTLVLSVGSRGCNLQCPFCQNADIAQGEPAVRFISPTTLVEEALRLRPLGNIGLAYTYNEPLTNYEYVKDCAQKARAANLKNILVTNGMISQTPWRELLPHIDAANIDLKAFCAESYRKVLGGSLPDVMRTIDMASEAGIHLEITTLIVPGFNDGDEEIEAMSAWLADLPRPPVLHLTRFFPRHRWQHLSPTDPHRLFTLRRIAQAHLKDVRLGNI